VTYGFPDPFSSSTQVFEDELLGYKVTVPPADGTIELTAIGVVAPGNSAKMAIYTDSNDRPEVLKASAAPQLLEGATEFPTFDISLEPGDYWIMVGFNATTQFSINQSSFARLCSLAHPFATNFPGTIDPGEVACSSQTVGNVFFRALKF
jgi:hypothetical protein